MPTIESEFGSRPPQTTSEV